MHKTDAPIHTKPRESSATGMEWRLLEPCSGNPPRPRAPLPGGELRVLAGITSQIRGLRRSSGKAMQTLAAIQFRSSNRQRCWDTSPRRVCPRAGSVPGVPDRDRGWGQARKLRGRPAARHGSLRVCPCWVVMKTFLDLMVTSAVELSVSSPAMIFRAMGVSSSCWMKRFSGLAP